MQEKIGFIGGGHMTAAIISGLVKNTDPATISVSNRSQAKLASLAQQFGVYAAADNAEVVSRSDVVVLSVKPQVMQAVLEPLATDFQQQKPLLISVAAGIKCRSLLDWVNEKLPLIRAMPNVPSAIGEGATGLFANPLVEAHHKKIAEGIFNAIGLSAWVEQENEIDLVTALSGSGPAYVMLLLKAMIDAAVARGMSHQSAHTLALQTVRGTAGVIASNDKPIAQWIEEMLLPGGTTEQAVAALRQHAVPQAVDAAIDAACKRAEQLAKELGKG